MQPGTGKESEAEDEGFLLAVGWILHHEHAHVRCNHQSSDPIYSVQEEREADDLAVDWVFGACTDERMRLTRQVGMLIALIALQYLDVPAGRDSVVRTHPPTTERIFRCLNRAGVEADGVVYALGAIALHFQLGQYGLSAPVDGQSFQEILDGALHAFQGASR